jgi:hypothetical protein
MLNEFHLWRSLITIKTHNARGRISLIAVGFLAGFYLFTGNYLLNDYASAGICSGDNGKGFSLRSTQYQNCGGMTEIKHYQSNYFF